MSTITILATHDRSASLYTLSKASLAFQASTTLALPTRFPTSSSINTTISATGHIFIWAEEGSIIWEYDSRGRRIAELDGGARVLHVQAFGQPGGAHGLVTYGLNNEVILWSKELGKWKRNHQHDGSPTGLAVNFAGDTIASVSASEVVLFNRSTEQRAVLPISSTEAMCQIAFSHALPSTLVMRRQSSIQLLCISQDGKPEIKLLRPFGEGRVLDAVSPPGDTKGLCAVLGENGEVALIGLDKVESAPKIISFGRALLSLTFLDGTLLAGRTSEGSLLAQDLRNLSSPPNPIKVERAIQSLHTIPSSAERTTRPGVTPATASSARVERPGHTRPSSRSSILGETRSAGNVPALPTLDHAFKENGKASRKSVHIHPSSRASAHSPPSDQGTKQDPQERQFPRVTSAPIAKPNAPPTSTSSRSLSQPLSRPDSTEPNAASSSRPRASIRRAPSTTFAPIEEETTDSPRTTAGPRDGLDDLAHEPSVDLTWALRTESRGSRAAIVEVSESSRGNTEMEEMRREIRSLQLNMLRMGRGLKNQIRMSLQPLLEELQNNRKVIEQQRLEIERLRRGF